MPLFRRIALPATSAFLSLALSLISPLFCSMPAQAQGTCSQSYIDGLPKPSPMPPAVKVVQLVNCSNQVLLGAANAAHQANQPGFPVFPREATWVMQPYGSPNNTNVLTIDIPPEWTNTKCAVGVTDCPALGPNIWVRTGCRYDATTNRAQCETGGCAGQYDCSSGGWGSPGYTSIVEWTFQDKYANNFDYPDISLVNGSSLNVDIEPVGGSPTNPKDSFDQHWLNYNYPLTVHGLDLRVAAACPNANGGGNFLLKRSDIDKSGVYGYVIVDAQGNPVMPPGDNVLACFSNCGKFEYPGTPAKDCDPTVDPRCYAWTTFCAPTGAFYSKKCSTDQDCIVTYKGKQLDIHASCWKRDDPNQAMGTCELRGFYRNQSSLCPDNPGSPASKIPCTFAYASTNPLDPIHPDYADQPPTAYKPPYNGLCSGVVGPDGKKVDCVGDDTVHQIFHGAYSWPNDPEVFDDDATLYRMVFAPGGTKVAITAAQNGVPLCKNLPSNYNYSKNYGTGGAFPCSAPVDNEGAVFAVANPNGRIWACALDQRGAGNEGVICRWHPAPPDCSAYGSDACVPCTTPSVDKYVTKSACGAIEAGTSLQSSFITPALNDPLFVEVTIAAVLNNVALPVVSGCASSWTVVKSQFINTNEGVAVWYKGVANTSSQCQVTATIAAENPAALKVYDVPKFNGTVETTSAATGNFVFPGSGQFPAVTAGTVTTSFARDLVLGNLLQENQQFTPITYWVNWLTNSLGVPPNNVECELNGQKSYLYCPTDDGTDYLPGHGPDSSNADAGHQFVGPGQHALQRGAQNLGSFGWAGVAIYVELNP